MYASTSVRQSVIKPRTSSRTSPKRTPSSPLDISTHPSRFDIHPWSPKRTHPATPDRSKHKAHAPTIDAPESSASPPSCICSPTTHQGSFRCRLHRESQKQWPNAAAASTSPAKASLEDETTVESRITSTPGPRVTRVQSPTGVPASPKFSTSDSGKFETAESGFGKSETPTAGIPANHKSELSSSPSFNSPTKTSRLRRMASAEDLKSESAYV